MANILVVDDEMGIRELLSEILSDEGHVVQTAENAQQAREARAAETPDLVLLDIWMPDTDGVTLLKEWQRDGYLTMPVIMMSGHATIDTAVEATRIGAMNFLEKPIALQKLLQAVQQGLARNQERNRPTSVTMVQHNTVMGETRTVSPVTGTLPIQTQVNIVASSNTIDASMLSFDLPLREARDMFERLYFEHHLAQEGGSMTTRRGKNGTGTHPSLPQTETTGCRTCQDIKETPLRKDLLMEYVNLGSSGLKVSRICLGMMTYGSPKWRPWVLDRAASRPFIRRAIDAGINFFDTANLYSNGLSEVLTGKLLKEYARRDEIIIATKVYFHVSDDITADAASANASAIPPNTSGLSRKHIFSAVDASLKRLGTDYIDLYQIHRWDPSTPIEETMEALNDVVRSGKVRYIGASSMWAWQFAKAQQIAREHNWSRFISMQNHYNLAYREEEREIDPALQGSRRESV